MAGQPGKSGGTRTGAGRPSGARNKKSNSGVPRTARAKPLPKPEIGESVEVKTGNDQDPLDYLMSVVNDIEADPRLRVRAAVAAAQYKHVKRGDGGKKEETAEKAVKAGQGKFKAAPSPLKLVGR